MVPSFIYSTYKAVFEMSPLKTNIFSPMGIIVSFVIVLLGGIMINYSTMKILRETPAELMKQKANELFGSYGVDLPLVFTPSGNYSEALSNDDTADALNLYASTREKYRKPLAFGKRRRYN